MRLADGPNGIETEDGRIWVYGVRDDGILAFTDFGIENLRAFVAIRKADAGLLKSPEQKLLRSCGPGRKLTLKVRGGRMQGLAAVMRDVTARFEELKALRRQTRDQAGA